MGVGNCIQNPRGDSMKKVIVVGAGLSGLITAVLLAGRGHHVTVVERSPILGGRSHVLRKDDYVLPYGAHAILAPKAEPVKAIFKELGIVLKSRSLSALNSSFSQTAKSFPHLWARELLRLQLFVDLGIGLTFCKNL